MASSPSRVPRLSFPRGEGKWFFLSASITFCLGSSSIDMISWAASIFTDSTSDLGKCGLRMISAKRSIVFGKLRARVAPQRRIWFVPAEQLRSRPMPSIASESSLLLFLPAPRRIISDSTEEIPGIFAGS